MNGRVCYVSSTDRGDRLATVSLIGARSEDTWRASASNEPVVVLSDVASAAGWIQERVASGAGRAAEVSLLCVDVEGANCSWLTAPSTDATIVAAALAHSTDGNSLRNGGAWAAPTLAEASVEALVERQSEKSGGESGGGGAALLKRMGSRRGKAQAKPQRLAVLAIPDVSARLLIDALDDRGVAVERVISLWHALASAWDPSAKQTSGSANEIVGAAPVTGIVMIDPAGRMVWAWSRHGCLLAAGTIRLPQDRHEMGTGVVRIGMPEIGRLTTDWLSWSVQIGAVPSRVICLAPSIGTDGDSDDLTPAAIGAALSRAWSAAPVDMAVHDDPTGATLNRLVDHNAGHDGDGQHEITLLTHRPGRAHRTMYHWAAACLLLVGVGLAAVGWKGYDSAAKARSQAEARRTVMIEQVSTLAPPTSSIDRETVKAQPGAYLQAKIGSKRASVNPQFDEARPILSELENLSYVLGTREVEIEELSFIFQRVDVTIRVPDTATAEWLKASLDTGVAETHCSWAGEFIPGTGVRRGPQPEWRYQTRYKLTGTWRTPETGTGAAGRTASTGGRP